jgi:hypothetical protein
MTAATEICRSERLNFLDYTFYRLSEFFRKFFSDGDEDERANSAYLALYLLTAANLMSVIWLIEGLAKTTAFTDSVPGSAVIGFLVAWMILQWWIWYRPVNRRRIYAKYSGMPQQYHHDRTRIVVLYIALSVVSPIIIIIVFL